MKSFDIYISGVGGQGIGLLSEILLRAADYSGYQAKAVDTHGLAQRGGIVVSQLRLGEGCFSPLIPSREADLAVALERHEAARAADTALCDGGTLVYYDTVLQPLGVRLGQDAEVTASFLNDICDSRKIKVVRVESQDMEDPRMQNIAVLARINGLSLVPGVTREHFLRAMEDLMTGEMLAKNIQIFNRLAEEQVE